MTSAGSKGSLSRGAASDVRHANLLSLLELLRSTSAMSRTQLADATGLAVPSVHRLIADLIQRQWVVPIEGAVARGPGRPTTCFRLRDERALVVGVDVGSATTRVALASLNSEVQARTSFETTRLRKDIACGLGREIQRLRASSGMSERPFAAAGVGVPAVVDPQGRLSRPWLESEWKGVPLRSRLAKGLDCEVVVAQDNHFAALGEGRPNGTGPAASPLLVVELGIGIGAGLTVDGQLVSGVDGGLGRLMGWPCKAPRGVTGGETLGELLTASGLLHQYRDRNGSRQVANGAELLLAASAGDRVASRVVRWAAGEFSATLRRIALLLNPELIVVGGGIGRGLFEGGYVDEAALTGMSGRSEVRVSRLGADAVVLGALEAARALIPAWLSTQLAVPEYLFRCK